MSELRIGSLLGGRYRLLRKLGEGGMGTVYVGVQEPLGRKVAVKVLLPVLARDATLVARFQREAELAASLGHPNIVQVTDFGIDDGAAFLVMDLLEGDSLGAVIERNAPLDAERVRFIATQILSALEAAHSRGVVHRDLKPDNIFLTSVSGVADLVKLLDFGIARLTEDADQKMTATGQVLGTPAYMAPEQARGRPVDARSDLYAVGVVMYEALSGRMPVSGSNYHELMFAIVDQIPTPLTELVPGLEPELIAIVDRAMNKDANARYASAADMRAALDVLGPLSARGLSRVPSRPPPTRVNGEVAMAATITPEALSAVVASDSARPAAIRPSVLKSPSATNRRLAWWLAFGALSVGIGIAAYVITRPMDDSNATVVSATSRGSVGSEDPTASEASAALEAAVEARTRAVVERVMQETATQLEARSASSTANTLGDSTLGAPTAEAPHDCRAIVEDPTPLRVRAVPSLRAEVRGELPTGARVEILERRDEAWGRIAEPLEGWIWMEMVREPCVTESTTAASDAPRERPRAPTSRRVRCGEMEQDTPIVQRGDEIVVATRRTNNLVPMDGFRELSYSWGPGLTQCYRGKPSVGGPFTLQVDTEGRVTRVTRNPYCEAPSGLESCVREVVLGAHVGNVTGAPGEVQFDISHRRPR